MKLVFVFLLYVGGILGLSSQVWGQHSPASDETISRIAFGSCADEAKDQPILYKVVEEHPDLFIYLGDNIYGDTRNMKRLAKKYEKLARKPSFQALCASTPILATWDDHDFGENDAGRHYPMKEESEEIFLDFWKEPTHSMRREHPGVYHARVLGEEGKRVQVILLDTRTFRDDLVEKEGKEWKNDYQPNQNPDSTFLGEAQWAWLEAQLMVPAEIRIIASSNQFSHAYNGWESWNNVPHEQKRMIELIQKRRAEGVLFISGDVHWGELSRREVDKGYPLYDLTSSGITQTWSSVEENEYRIGEPMRDVNFGLIEIDWTLADPSISLVLKDVAGQTVLQHSVSKSELTWK